MRPRAGFTLLEIVLYVAISAVLAGSMGLLVSTVGRSRARAAAIAEVETEGRFAMQQMLGLIRNARSVSSPAPGSADASVALETDDASASPVTFFLSDGSIAAVRGTAGPIGLTGGRVAATDLSFENVSRSGTPGSVRIQFTLTAPPDSEPGAYQYVETFYGTASLR